MDLISGSGEIRASWAFFLGPIMERVTPDRIGLDIVIIHSADR